MPSTRSSTARQRRANGDVPSGTDEVPTTGTNFHFSAQPNEKVQSPAEKRGWGSWMHTTTFDSLSKHPIASYLADNESIVGGYRVPMPWKSAIASMFAWHNETVNVWTHGIGGVTFLALFVFVLLGGLNHAQLPGIDGSMLHEAETISSAIRNTVTADVERWTGASPAALHMDDGRAITAQEAEEDLWYADPAHIQEAVNLRYRPHASEVAQWPVMVFLGSAVTLLFASATYHLMYVVGQDWFVVLSRLDYASIALLIYGSTVPALYYGFYCVPNWLYIYSFFSALTCGSCLVLGLSPQFRSNDWRLVRMSSFIACGLFGVLPFSHMFLVSDQQHLEALYGLLLMGFLYISGALLYGFRIPERYFPGRFDLMFASHQIFHMCVNAACVVHYLTVVAHYRWRTEHAVCAAT